MGGGREEMCAEFSQDSHRWSAGVLGALDLCDSNRENF